MAAAISNGRTIANDCALGGADDGSDAARELAGEGLRVALNIPCRGGVSVGRINDDEPFAVAGAADGKGDANGADDGMATSVGTSHDDEPGVAAGDDAGEANGVVGNGSVVHTASTFGAALGLCFFKIPVRTSAGNLRDCISGCAGGSCTTLDAQVCFRATFGAGTFSGVDKSLGCGLAGNGSDAGVTTGHVTRGASLATIGHAISLSALGR